MVHCSDYHTDAVAGYYPGPPRYCQPLTCMLQGPSLQVLSQGLFICGVRSFFPWAAFKKPARNPAFGSEPALTVVCAMVPRLLVVTWIQCQTWHEVWLASTKNVFSSHLKCSKHGRWCRPISLRNAHCMMCSTLLLPEDDWTCVCFSPELISWNRSFPIAQSPAVILKRYVLKCEWASRRWYMKAV